MENDDFNQVPANVATIVDLLDTKKISWAEYQEDIPFPGFQGYNYSNQETYANDYVRKHDRESSLKLLSLPDSDL
jgi:acid phosphatase